MRLKLFFSLHKVLFSTSPILTNSGVGVLSKGYKLHVLLSKTQISLRICTESHQGLQWMSMGSQVSGVSSDEKVLSKTGQTAADFNFHCTPIPKYLMLDTNSYLVGFKVTKVSRVGLVAGQIRPPNKNG